MNRITHFRRAGRLMAIGAAMAITMTASISPAWAQPEHASHSYLDGDGHYLSAAEIDAMIPSQEELAAMIPSEAELRAMIPSEAEMHAMMPDREAIVAEALAGALQGLREARNEVASEADMPSDIRTEVLASLDAHIARLSR